MSSPFDVPLQLALLLSLAASGPAHEAPRPAETPAPSSVSLVTEPLEGPLHFGETVWLRAVKAASGDTLAADYGRRIFKTSGGRFYVPSADDRRRILDARRDEVLAQRVATAFAESNARSMHAELHRAPTAGDLYIAHVFGPDAAIALIKAATRLPDSLAIEQFPGMTSDLALSAPPHALPLTVAQLYRRLTAALREPPRLVAIGLKPSIAETAQAGAARAPEAIAWRTEVSIAHAAQPLQ